MSIMNMDKEIIELINKERLPGIAVGVIYDNKIIIAKGFEVTSIITKEKVDENTLFNMASISKTFVAMAIMQLVERGKISLDKELWNINGQGDRGGYRGNIGLSWFLGKYKEINLITHGGKNMKFASELYLMPELNSGIIMVANGDYAHIGPMCEKIIDSSFRSTFRKRLP